MIASGSDDNTVRLWEVETGHCRQVWRGHTNCIKSVAFSPKGSLVASGSLDKTVRFWDTGKSDCIWTIIDHLHCVKSLAFSSTGDWIVTGCYSKRVQLWRLENRTWVRPFSSEDVGYVESVAFSPKGGLVVCGSRDNKVRLLNASSGHCLRVMSGHGSHVTSVVFSPNGKQVASGSEDNSVRVWSVESGQALATIQRFQGPVNSIVWCTKSGQDYLMTGEDNGVVQLCNIRQLVEDGNRYDVRLCWIAPQRLALTDATALDVRGLSESGKQLFRQHGAVDVPNLG
jgi:WD40 repeat protein